MREVFIYYRIQMNQIDTAQREIQAFQARMVAAHPGLSARLLQRADAGAGAGAGDGDHPTWMEHYRIDADDAGGAADITDAMLTRLAREASLQLSRWIVGPRHTEVFIPCAS